MSSRDETRKIEIIMNGQQANASIKEMKASALLLWNQLQKLPEGSKEFIAKSKEFQQVSNRLKGVTTEARGVQKGFQMLQMTAQQFLGVFSGFMIFQKISTFFTDTISKSKEFEASLSELRSITGATTEDMIFYSEQAREMGAVTTKSATEVAQAFTIIGSKKPELLQSKEALAEVTRETIFLAEAAKISIPEAADALSQALNKFDLASDQSSRVVNVLAESYRKGSVDIGQTAAELAKFGGIAKEQGLSVEQSASLIQNVGKTVEESGVKIRNVLLKLAEGADETNPAVVGLDKALENLGNQNLTVADLAEKFGTQNAEAALMMIKQREEVKKMTLAITDTSAAYEMAATNTDNYESELARLDSAVTDIKITIGNGLLPVLRVMIENFALFLLAIKETPKFIRENKDLFYALGIALVTLNASNIAMTASTIAHVAIEKGRALATKASAAGQWLLNAAMTANPIGLIIKGVALLGAGFIILYNRSETVRGGIAGIWESMKQLADNVGDIFTAIASGDFSGLMSAFKNIGTGVGDSFNKGYAEKIAVKEIMEAEKAEAAVVAIETNEELLVIEDEFQEKIKVKKEDLAAKKLEADRKYEDLKTALITDAHEREKEQLRLKFERELEDLVVNSETYTLEKMLLEQQQKEAFDELKLKHEEEDLARKMAAKEQELQEWNADEELQLLRIENRFLQAVYSETAKEEAEYAIRKEYAEKKLALMTEMHGAESVEAERAKNVLLKLEKDHADKKTETEEQYQDAVRNMRMQGLDYTIEVFENGVSLLKEESKARKVAGNALKAFSTGKVAVDLMEEIQAIWKTANANPTNILFPGSGNILAGFKTAAALTRAGIATKKIHAQKFAAGGGTLPMVNVDGMWQAANNVGSFSPGGMVGSASIGIIGEKGAEWVAPNWMLRNPKTANIIGMLEGQRQANAYAGGGSTGASGMSDPMGGKLDNVYSALMQLNNQMQQMNATVAQWPQVLKVYNVLSETEDGLRLLQKLRNDGSIG